MLFVFLGGFSVFFKGFFFLEQMNCKRSGSMSSSNSSKESRLSSNFRREFVCEDGATVFENGEANSLEALLKSLQDVDTDAGDVNSQCTEQWNKIQECGKKLMNIELFCRRCSSSSSLDLPNKNVSKCSYEDTDHQVASMSSRASTPSCKCGSNADIPKISISTQTQTDSYYASPKSIYDSPRRLSVSSQNTSDDSDQYYSTPSAMGVPFVRAKMAEIDAGFCHQVEQPVLLEGEEHEEECLGMKLGSAVYDTPKRIMVSRVVS